MLLIFLILPAFINCSILINIECSTDSKNSTAIARGFVRDVISNKERNTFGLSDDKLKAGAENLSGGRPQDVFVRSPTPWNDLYKTYGWKEVTRILVPTTTKIVGVLNEQITVANKELTNNKTATANFSAAISQDVTNTVNSTWKKMLELTTGKSMKYNIKMIESEMRYDSTWGVSFNESKIMTIGFPTGVEVLLDPGQSIVSSLTAKRISLTIEVDYTVKLIGSVACNYPKRYKGHHFWAYNVNKLMSAANLPNVLNDKEIIKIVFYSDPKLVVSDLNTKKVLLDRPMVMYSH